MVQSVPGLYLTPTKRKCRQTPTQSPATTAANLTMSALLCAFGAPMRSQASTRGTIRAISLLRNARSKQSDAPISGAARERNCQNSKPHRIKKVIHRSVQPELQLTDSTFVG